MPIFSLLLANPILSKILTIITLSALFGAGGFWLGVKHEAHNQALKQIDVVVKTQVASAQEARKSVQISANVERQAATSIQNTQSIAKLATARISAQQQLVCKQEKASGNEYNPISTSIYKLDPWTFDVGTVRLLNAARSNDTFDATSLGDVANQAPSSVGVTEFVENDLTVVGMYHDLAIRHAALQDYVTQKQDQNYALCQISK